MQIQNKVVFLNCVNQTNSNTNNLKIDKMKVYSNKTDKIDNRKCLYGEIRANNSSRKKAARRQSKREIEKDCNNQ